MSATDVEYLEGRLEKGAYEEYSGVEYRSPGCTEKYNVIKSVTSPSRHKNCRGLKASPSNLSFLGGTLFATVVTYKHWPSTLFIEMCPY